MGAHVDLPASQESKEKWKALAARMKLYSHGETMFEHLLFGASKLGNTHRAETQNPETKQLGL